jgi:hypothetical protein
MHTRLSNATKTQPRRVLNIAFVLHVVELVQIVQAMEEFLNLLSQRSIYSHCILVGNLVSIIFSLDFLSPNYLVN